MWKQKTEKKVAGAGFETKNTAIKMNKSLSMRNGSWRDSALKTG